MTESDLEREFRAMLADRSREVPMSPSPFHSLSDRIAREDRRRTRRFAGAALAAVVAAAGIGLYARGHHQTPAPATAASAFRDRPVVFAYDDGKTAFASETYSDPHPDLSGYVGYMRDAAEGYLILHSHDPRNPAPDFSKLIGSGDTIVTTFDHQLMDDAARAADAGLWHSGGFDQAAHLGTRLSFAAVDPKTGYVKALYSGVDGVEDRSRNTTDDATTTLTRLGSAIDPILLSAALENGHPSADAPGVTAAEETAMLNRLGIDGITAGANLPVPSMDESWSDVGATALETADAYAVFPAGGVYRDAVMVSEVLDAKGQVIWRADTDGTVTMTPQTAASVGASLREDGAAAGARRLQATVTDGWSVGYTPGLSTGVVASVASPSKPSDDMDYSSAVWDRFVAMAAG